MNSTRASLVSTNSLQTFVYNSILLTGFKCNCTVKDFLCTWHWLLINFHVIQNCMQKFVMHRKFWETSILKLDDFVFVLSIVYTSFVISADNIRYNCELDSQSGNTWTATILRDGTTDQRRCIQVIPMTQQLPGGSEGEMFLLYRGLDKGMLFLLSSYPEKFISTLLN